MESLMNCMVICTCVVLALITIPSVGANENVRCELRRVVVHVVNENESAGKAIELLECSGPYMEKQRCAATKWVELDVQRPRSKDGALARYINHTQCAMRCSKNGSGRSARNKCNDTDKYRIACPQGTDWSFNEGKCEKDLKTDCNRANKDEQDNSISLSMFILAMVVELIVVVVAVFLIRDACKYHQNRESGVFYKTSEYVRSLSNRPHEGNITLRKDRSDTGSESFLPHYSTSNGKINHV